MDDTNALRQLVSEKIDQAHAGREAALRLIEHFESSSKPARSLHRLSQLFTQVLEQMKIFTSTSCSASMHQSLLTADVLINVMRQIEQGINCTKGPADDTQTRLDPKSDM